MFLGVIWTCSIQDKNIKLESYKDFVLFWDTLLQSTNNEEFYQTIILEKLIDTLFNIISKLDLSTLPLETNNELQMNIKIENLRANNIKDFHVFLNIVDLFDDILKSTNSNRFSSYLYSYLHKLMELSYRHPLISGFYKLMTAGVLHISALEIDSKEIPFYQHLNLFLFDLLNQFQQYKDDLQVSMIQFVLSCPINMMEPVLFPMLIKVLEVSFEIGQIHLNLCK